MNANTAITDHPVETREIVSIRVDATNYARATVWVVERAQRRESAYVCVANVHMTMEAHDDEHFAEVVNNAPLVVPDGMPLAWALRMLGVRNAERVRGPTLVVTVAKAAAESDIPIGIYGGTPAVAEAFAQELRRLAPGLQVAKVVSPPFRQLSDEEEAALVEQIEDAGARILFVGLGCPKQEKWMARNSERFGGVMLGVGAAFDFHAGSITEAPVWMQRSGLEWLFRLAQEPRRLFGRYMRHNPRFIYLLVRQLLSHYDRKPSTK